MTPEAQRIAIAEACGWRFVSDFMTGDEPDFQERKQAAILCWVRPCNARHQQEELPDYLSDLNAMHEAEKTILRSERDALLRELATIRGTDWGFATAAERAEAFLRTIGKWDETGKEQP